MKKLFITLIGILLTIGLDSCNSCSVKEVADTPITVENVIALDRQTMFTKYSEDYRWFETGVQLKDWLDEENDGSIEMVVNVFQVVENIDSTSADTFVYKFQHFVDGTISEEAIHGFWVEDYPLNEETIVVTFKEAYDKVMSVNLPKPHTRQVVLRKEVGPKSANPQWIFGNLKSQIYVDAVTGDVRNYDPAFEGVNLGTPLGEWP